jgi:hypothetical protein
MKTYEWIDSMAACYRGSLENCENWSNQLVTEGWVRNDNRLSHPNHGQVLTLVEYIEPQKVLDKVIDGILTVNVMQGRKETMRIVPEMFYYKDTFAKDAWEYFVKHPTATKDHNQSIEELGAVGQAYFVPLALLYS